MKLVSIVPSPKDDLVFWSPAEFAARHHVHRATVDRWIAEGKLQAAKVGKFTRIFPQHEAAFLNAIAA
jgi:excisionase family DNA binding protein